MKVFLDKKSIYYSEKSKVLENCITVTDGTTSYYYEFVPNGNKALVITNNLSYITDAVLEYRKYKKYINIFYTKDRSYYEEFEYTFSFKLPISCIQPSKFFIDSDALDLYEKYKEYDETYVKVAIINEEYVCIDGHTKLYAMLMDYEKLVNVFIDDYPYYINDLVYIAKEQNLRNIKSINVVNHEEYEKYWLSFINEYEEK